MSMKSALYNHLKEDEPLSALVDGRIYPVVAPQSTTFPYITYSRSRANHVRHMTAASGLAAKTFMIECFASSDVEATAMANLVREALDHFRGDMDGIDQTEDVRAVFLEDEGDFYNPPYQGGEQGVYQVTMDLTIWHVESVPTF